MIDIVRPDEYRICMSRLLKLFRWAAAAPLLLSFPACSSLQISSRDAGMSEADYQTAVIVYQRLQNDPVTSRYNFHVSAEAGVVTLSGWIQDPQVRNRAISVVQGAQSVQTVVDRMSR